MKKVKTVLFISLVLSGFTVVIGAQPAEVAKMAEAGDTNLAFSLKFNDRPQQPTDKVSGSLEVEIQAQSIKSFVSVDAKQRTPVELSVEDIWEQLSPGTTCFNVKFNGSEQESLAVNWNLAEIRSENNSLCSLDLKPYNNMDIRKLYGYDFEWRADYTGAAVGVDWRDTLRIDEKGYRIFVPPVSLMGWGTLPEIYPIETQWLVPDWPEKWDIHVDFASLEGKKEANNILALVNTKNNASIPSEAVIKLAKPTAVEKMYLLTANLTKTSKSYYPAAEVIIKYDIGNDQIIQLIPPYTMASFNQP
jgi:hypothetical protein